MMVGAVATEDDARELALSLPATIEKPSYGMPGFRVKDRLFARIREERDVFVVWCGDLEEKDFLIRAEPEKFFTTPHYDGHPSVLVRLGRSTGRSSPSCSPNPDGCAPPSGSSPLTTPEPIPDTALHPWSLGSVRRTQAQPAP